MPNIVLTVKTMILQLYLQLIILVNPLLAIPLLIFLSSIPIQAVYIRVTKRNNFILLVFFILCELALRLSTYEVLRAFAMENTISFLWVENILSQDIFMSILLSCHVALQSIKPYYLMENMKNDRIPRSNLSILTSFVVCSVFFYFIAFRKSTVLSCISLFSLFLSRKILVFLFNKLELSL